MKKFQEYLAESERTYNYRIKIVGDTPPNFLKDMDTLYARDEPCWYSASVQWIEFPFFASIAEPVCG